MKITAKMVSDLRELTGASMMECKRALEAATGDIEAAKDNLRKAGLKAAEKKAGRDTGKGRVAVALRPDASAGAIVGLSCETDFVAKTEDFINLVQGLAEHVLANKTTSAEALIEERWAKGGSVGDAIKSVIGKLGENMRVAHLARLETPGARVGSYVHHTLTVGALAAISANAPAEKIDEFNKQLCMHQVASIYRANGLTRAEVPLADIQREKAVLSESEDVISKPEPMREKIVQGRMEKFFSERVLPDQPWAMDEKLSVSKVLQATLGAGAKITGFARSQVG